MEVSHSQSSAKLNCIDEHPLLNFPLILHLTSFAELISILCSALFTDTNIFNSIQNITKNKKLPIINSSIIVFIQFHQCRS